MKIDIISDVACPWCYVGKKNLEKALAQRPDIEFEIQWFPYQLHPEVPPEGYPYRETVERKYGAERIAMMFEHITQTGKAAGIDFRFDLLERGANTLDAHRVLDFAWHKGKQNEMAEALFEAYLCQGRFVGDKDVLADIAGEVGLDRQEARDFLESEDGVARVREQIDFARRNGVSGVPAFSFDGMFAISGGQASDVFLNVIDRIQEKTVTEEGAACTPDGCP
ncbi:MAG TPA: hypothetical protein DCZ13_14505 [Porticoccaceae bacterium]|nr:hypothetical protein [Porticoccaceae bacterium]